MAAFLLSGPCSRARRSARRLLVCNAVISVLLAVAGIPLAEAAPRSETLSVDLVPLIDQAARDPSRFAVELPHQVSLDTAGEWSEAAGVARWHYSLRVPTAVSLSFHGYIRLPRGATLTVSGQRAQFLYTSDTVRAGELWSRILRGNTLDLLLTVPGGRNAATSLQIVAFQAGYRGLGAGIANHPEFDRIRARNATLRAGGGASVSAATSTPACIENYACNATAANAGPARSSVAIVVSNLLQCTATLVGNVRNDGVPYVLTARHCETGNLGGGDPARASQVVVYWEAQTPCGTPLGDLYEPNIVTQGGATTIVEQQDLWLIRLYDQPVISDPYFAGFDATGGVVQGGYSIHHALSTKKQFVTWFGQAVPVHMSPSALGVGYASDFWGVTNERGFYGPGASGGALFDQNDRVVGTASLGRETGGGPGNCPVTPLLPPTANSAAGLFTSLAAVWDSTADPTSTTGTATLASTLDPDNTGTRILAGTSGLYFSPRLSATPGVAPINTPVTLNWDATNATSCTADGGVSGDGWSGPRALQGPATVTSANVASISYGISCSYPGGRQVRSSVTVNWTVPQPQGQILPRSLQVWLGSPYVVQWDANTGPCNLTPSTPVGPGSSPTTGLPAQGAATLIFTQPGDGQIELACGPGPVSVGGTTYQVIPPSVDFTVNATDRILGQLLRLNWDSIAETCTPYGGAQNDGWIAAQRGPQGGHFPNITSTGTYTYGLVCTAGTVTVQKEITVKVTNDPPYVTLDATPATVALNDSFTVRVKSNIDNCFLSGRPGAASSQEFVSAETTFNVIATPVGTHTMQVSCSSNGLSASSPPVVVTIVDSTPPPPAPIVSLNTSASQIHVGESVTITWSTTDADSCTASGDPNFDGPMPVSGSTTLTPTQAGTLSLALSCSGNGQTAGADVAVGVLPASTPPPTSGGGGGGATDFLTMMAIAALARARRLSVIAACRPPAAID